jgi:lysylphosphatidylglycerol synthetase-like protein (DUF2156 family)
MRAPNFDYYFNRYGTNAHTHLLAYSDVRYFQARCVEGLIGYAAVPGLWVAMADPLCDPCDYGAVLYEFLLAARRAKVVPCFILCSPDFVRVATQAAMWALRIGEQFVFDLPVWGPRGNAARKVRSAANKARRLGVTVRELYPTGGPADADTRTVQAVADRWLGGKESALDLFLLGLHLFESRRYKRYFAAFLEDEPQAVLICSPVPVRHGILFEDMVRVREATVSASELLVLDTLAQLRAEGVCLATFGCSPHVDPAHPPVPLMARLALAAAMPFVNAALPLRRIYHYHNKFAASRVEDVYLLSPRRIPFWRIIWGILSTCNLAIRRRAGRLPQESQAPTLSPGR